MKNRGQAKVFGFMLVILVLGFTIFVYSLPAQSEITREYTPSTLTTCKTTDGKETCNLVLYSGIRNIYEDNEWKLREEARSFKDSGIECKVIFDGVNLAKCIDWNETSRTIEFSTKTERAIPLRKYTKEFNETSKEIERRYTKEFEQELNIKADEKKVLTIKANSGEIIEFGEYSTEIILEEPDVENLEDGYCNSNDHDKSYGYTTEFQTYTAVTPRVHRGYIKFNINPIPEGQRIDSASLYVYKSSNTGIGSRNINIHHVYDIVWNEGTVLETAYYPILTWNSQPCGTAFDNITSCNTTAETIVTTDETINIWWNWSVKEMLQKDYDANKSNFSMAIKYTTVEAGATTYKDNFNSKEHGTASQRPYLNITYSVSNVAPVIGLQAPVNNTELTPGSVEFIYNVFDVDGDNVDNCSLWLNDGGGFEEVDNDTSITQVVNQSFSKSLSIGNYTWKVKCFDNNTNLGESEIRKIIIFGVNNPPTIDTPSISPDPTYTDSAMNCSTTAYDVDMDSITIYFDWYNNSVLAYNGSTPTSNGTLVTALLDSGVQAKDEEWNCTVRAFDGQNYSSYESDSITISNSIPTHGKPVLSSTSDYNASNENLTCYNQNTQDLDNDVVTNIFSWYLDSSPLAKLNMPFEINADDYSGNNNDGTEYGNPQYVTGKYGNALDFDGNDYIKTGSTIPSSSSFTYTAWIKTNSLSNTQIPISTNIPTNNGLYIDTNGKLSYDYIGTLVAVTPYETITADNWYFIATTYDGTTIKNYVNSELKASQAYTCGALGGYVFVGVWPDTSTGFFNGIIDEVKIYNRALSAAEITEHFNLNYDKIVSSETSVDDVFKCKVVPNDGDTDGLTRESNSITIKPNIYDITFNITSGEDGSSLTGIDISCDNSWSVTNINSPYTHKFYEGSYTCEFERKEPEEYYNKTITFTANKDKPINVVMSIRFHLTIQEHNWIEAIYTCLYEGDCKTLDLLEQINETTENLWDQFQPTDESVVIQEDILSNTLSTTQNITINYTIKAPPKAGYSTGDYAPMRIAFWFLDTTNNESCLDQDKITTDTNRAENTYCIPLIAETLAVVNEEVNFLAELRPNLPEGSYEIVRDIEIDPNEIWIKYGQEIIDNIDVLESNDGASVFVIKSEPKEVFDEGTEPEVQESSGLTIVTSSATSDTVEETTSEIKSLLSGSQIVGVIGMVFGLLTIIIICFTIFKIKVREK